MKILVIEDSRILQVAIRRALLKAGHTAVLAGDGQEGVELASKVAPDVILLDIMLPKTTGVSVLQILRSQSNTANIPVFILTSLSERNQGRLIEAGASRYFEKSDQLLEHNFSEVIEALDAINTPLISGIRSAEAFPSR